MINKNSIIPIFFLLSVVLLAGCDSNRQNINTAALNKASEKNAAEETALTFPDVYEEDVDETLSFHASVVPPIGLQTKNMEIQLSYKAVDFDIALDELFTDVGIIKREEMILQPENSLYQSAYGEQDEVISNSIGMFYMEKTHWAKARNAIELSQKDLAYNAELYSVPQDFGFGTAEEAWESLQQTLHKFGVKTELKPTIFYMDYDTMAKEDRKNKDRDDLRRKEEDKIWSEDDNGYYISAVQCINGNTVFSNIYYGNGIEGEADSANVLAFIDKSGIQMLEISRIISEVKDTDRYWEMLPFQSIVDAVKKRFALTITGDKVDIKKFQFSYLTEALDDEIYRLLPVWFCNYEQIGIDDNVRMRQLIINAETGEEVIYELY